MMRRENVRILFRCEVEELSRAVLEFEAAVYRAVFVANFLTIDCDEFVAKLDVSRKCSGSVRRHRTHRQSQIAEQNKMSE